MRTHKAFVSALCVLAVVYLSLPLTHSILAQSSFRVYLPLVHRPPPVIAFSKGGIAIADAYGNGVIPLTPSAFGGFNPSWSPDGTQIVFSARNQSDAENTRFSLYIVNTDGTALRQVTTSSYNAYTPAWSPDRNTIAFVSDRSGVRNIYLIEADGTRLRQLTNEPFGVDAPTWSPEGGRIAFTQYPTEFDRRVAIIWLDGSKTEAMALPPNWYCRDPDWAPSGERLAYVCTTDTLARVPRPPQNAAATHPDRYGD